MTKQLFYISLSILHISAVSQTIFYQYEAKGIPGAYSISSIILSKKLNNSVMYYNVKEYGNGKLISENFYEPSNIIKGKFNTYKFESKTLKDDFFVRAKYEDGKIISFNQVKKLDDTLTMDVGGSINFVKVIPSFNGETSKNKFKDWIADIKQFDLDRGEMSPPYINSPDNHENPLATSTLKTQGKFSYEAANLVDDNPLTAWVEGKEDYGIGESFTITKNYVSGISILNGHQANQTSFTNNSKVKKFALYINGNLSAYLELEDKMDLQKFNSSEFTSLFDEFVTNESESTKKFNLKFEIVDVFQGLKYKDTCISELSDF